MDGEQHRATHALIGGKSMPSPETTEPVEQIARMVDPEAFGLPNIVEDGTITDRDEARDKARVILAWIENRYGR